MIVEVERSHLQGHGTRIEAATYGPALTDLYKEVAALQRQIVAIALVLAIWDKGGWLF